MLKITKLKISFLITLFAGVTTAYFIWLVWNKLTEMIGNSDLVLLITGGLVLLFLITGMVSFKKLSEKFM